MRKLVFETSLSQTITLRKHLRVDSLISVKLIFLFVIKVLIVAKNILLKTLLTDQFLVKFALLTLELHNFMQY